MRLVPCDPRSPAQTELRLLLIWKQARAEHIHIQILFLRASCPEGKLRILIQLHLRLLLGSLPLLLGGHLFQHGNGLRLLMGHTLWLRVGTGFLDHAGLRSFSSTRSQRVLGGSILAFLLINTELPCSSLQDGTLLLSIAALSKNTHHGVVVLGVVQQIFVFLRKANILEKIFLHRILWLCFHNWLRNRRFFQINFRFWRIIKKVINGVELLYLSRLSR